MIHSYLRSFYITDVKWLSNQTLFCSWVSKGITSLIQTTASQQNKWHLNEVRKRGDPWFFAAHFGQYLGDFGVFETCSKSKSMHICMLLVFPVVSLTLLDLRWLISIMYLCSIHLKPPIPDADCAVISCSY